MQAEPAAQMRLHQLAARARRASAGDRLRVRVRAVVGQFGALGLFHGSRFPGIFCLFLGELLGKVVLGFQKHSESINLIKEKQRFGELGYSSVRLVL